MHIEFTFKNIEPSEHLKKYVRRRLEKVGRFLGRNPNLTLQVVMAVDKFRHQVEVQLTGEGLNIKASETSDDMYATIDMVTDRLESQIRKQASLRKNITKSREKHGEPDVDIYTYELSEEDGVQVVNGTENFSKKPLFLDEAIMQLQQNDSEVLVFVNAELARINVLYRKRNGEFGLIDPIV